MHTRGRVDIDGSETSVAFSKLLAYEEVKGLGAAGRLSRTVQVRWLRVSLWNFMVISSSYELSFLRGLCDLRKEKVNE